jgi:TolA-binding protein
VKNTANDLYQEGIELFEQKQYTVAQNKFEAYQKHPDKQELKTTNAAYYSALISIYLYHADGEDRIKNFVQENPSHTKALEAYYELGNFYFREKT